MPADGPKFDFATIVAPGTEPKIHSIFDFTAESLEQLAFWLEQRGLHIPINQVLGFSQTVQKDGGTITTDESRTTATYANLTTTGPSLTGLSDGTYVIYFGCTVYNPAGVGDGRMSIDVNSAGAADADAVLHSGGNFNISLSRTLVKTLTAGGNNTLVAKYKGDGANASHFLNRWLIAQRIGNA